MLGICRLIAKTSMHGDIDILLRNAIAYARSLTPAEAVIHLRSVLARCEDPELLNRLKKVIDRLSKADDTLALIQYGVDGDEDDEGEISLTNPSLRVEVTSGRAGRKSMKIGALR